MLQDIKLALGQPGRGGAASFGNTREPSATRLTAAAITAVGICFGKNATAPCNDANATDTCGARKHDSGCPVGSQAAM